MCEMPDDPKKPEELIHPAIQRGIDEVEELLRKPLSSVTESPAMIWERHRFDLPQTSTSKFSEKLRKTLRTFLHFSGLLGAFVIGAAVLAFSEQVTRSHLINLLYRSLLSFTASQGGNIWGFVSSNVVAPGLLVILFIVLLRESHGEEAMRIHWRRDGIIGMKSIVLVIVLYYFPIFLWKGVVRTVYEDHMALVAGTSRLTKENGMLNRENDKLSRDIATLTRNQPVPLVESPDSLRRRTLKVVNDLTLFWSRRPLPLQPVQNPSTDEERQRNAKWDAYWHEANAAYVNAGFRERILGIVRQYKAKGVDIGFLEQAAEQSERTWGAMAYGGTDCSRYQSELCQLRELAYHVDANDNAIVLTLEGSK